MTKLRSRLLVSLVLVAVALAIVGIDVASARAYRSRTPAWQTSYSSSRPGAGSYSGEPDQPGNGAPAVKPVCLNQLPNLWLADIWIKWSQHFGRPKGYFLRLILPSKPR